MKEVIKIIESSRYLRFIESRDENSNINQLMIVSNANMGRYACYVDLDGGVVIESDLKYSD